MSSQTPIETYTSLLETSTFVFLVYYRGHWCPFCMSYLSQLQSIATSIASAGGSLLVITSEPEQHLAATRKASGFQGTILVDIENVLAQHLRERGMVDVAISEKKGYVHGMAQPAVLVVRGGKGVPGERSMGKDGEVLESWAIVPSMMNLGGAKDRPNLNQVWDNVQAKLEGNKPVHAKYSLLGSLAVLKERIFG